MSNLPYPTQPGYPPDPNAQPPYGQPPPYAPSAPPAPGQYPPAPYPPGQPYPQGSQNFIKKFSREHSYMTSDVFWVFLTYLPTLIRWFTS